MLSSKQIATLIFLVFVIKNDTLEVNSTLKEIEILELPATLLYPKQKPNVKLQNFLTVPFPCANFTIPGVGRSTVKPNSVHKLRPGDIDVIAAMGDSLIAGSGALEEWALGNMIEHRGVSWCIGGQSTWRTFLTLPNILKVFNPNLTGYSTGVGEFFTSNAQLNVAFPVAADSDALNQAKLLVKKIKKLRPDTFETDWKMITVFFGANDICSAQCFDKRKSSPREHARKLMIALDYLYQHLTRTFVNLIPVLDVSISLRMKRSWMCKLMHFLYCTCFHQVNNPMTIITSLTQQYQMAEEILVSSGRYDKRHDFTVVLQPFIKIYNAPLHATQFTKEAIDSNYITYDCFHFSQKGHALGANMLWNNLLQPVGSKKVERLRGIMEKFECPSARAPYFFTTKNSAIFYLTSRQDFQFA